MLHAVYILSKFRNSTADIFTWDDSYWRHWRCNFHQIQALNTATEVWISSFKPWKQVQWSPWTKIIATSLAATVCKAMSLFQRLRDFHFSSIKIIDIVASWCTKCHRSRKRLQLLSTLHVKHRKGWKQWQHNWIVLCTSGPTLKVSKKNLLH